MATDGRVVLRINGRRCVYAISVWGILAHLAAVLLPAMTPFSARLLLLHLGIVSWGFGKKLCS